MVNSIKNFRIKKGELNNYFLTKGTTIAINARIIVTATIMVNVLNCPDNPFVFSSIASVVDCNPDTLELN